MSVAVIYHGVTWPGLFHREPHFHEFPWSSAEPSGESWGKQDANLSSATIISREWGHPGLAMSGWWSWLDKWCSFCNVSSYGSSPPHLPWWGHLYGHERLAISPCHILLHALASHSQEPHLALFHLIHTLQPEKVLFYKTFIRSWKKMCPYCFIVCFKDDQEKSILLPLGNLNTYLSSKDMGLSETAVMYTFSIYCGLLLKNEKRTELEDFSLNSDNSTY